MGWLDDSVALISGGGSGLGRALVERFVAEGARVGVIESNPQRADDLSKNFGEKVAVTVGTITRPDDNEKAVAQTVARFGRLDTYVANAGIFDFFQPLAKYESGAQLASAFDELMAVNVKGGLLGVHAALPNCSRAAAASSSRSRTPAFTRAAADRSTPPPSTRWLAWCVSWRTNWRQRCASTALRPAA